MPSTAATYCPGSERLSNIYFPRIANRDEFRFWLHANSGGRSDIVLNLNMPYLNCYVLEMPDSARQVEKRSHFVSSALTLDEAFRNNEE